MFVRRLHLFADFLLHNPFLQNSHGSYRCHSGTDFLGCFFSTHCSRFGAISSSLRSCYRLFSSLCSIVSAGSSDCGTVGSCSGLFHYHLTFIIVRLTTARDTDHQGKDREERKGRAFPNKRFPHRLPPFRRGACFGCGTSPPVNLIFYMHRLTSGSSSSDKLLLLRQRLQPGRQQPQLCLRLPWSRQLRLQRSEQQLQP